MARDVAWVAPDNLHLTLKFLGGVDAERLDAVATAVTAAAAGSPAFDLGLRGLGAFPSSTRPRVLWAGVDEGRAAATTLARGVEDALAGLGFERETRAFSPHVTLGRVRVPRPTPRLAEALAARDHLGRQAVASVALMRSDLSSRGARYSELATVPLAAASPA